MQNKPLYPVVAREAVHLLILRSSPGRGLVPWSYAGDRIVVGVPDERFFVDYGIAPVSVHYGREAAVRQKIHALGGRREAQARDVSAVLKRRRET